MIATTIALAVAANFAARAEAGEARWVHVCDPGFIVNCYWVLTGTDSGSGSQESEASSDSTAPPSHFDPGNPDPCYYRQLAIQPPPDDPRWGDNDPAMGRLWQAFCPESLKIASHLGSGDNVIGSIIGGDPYYVDSLDTADAAYIAIDPIVLVSRARGAFDLPSPEPSFGPNAGELAVKVPVWFSVAEFAPITQSATAGRYTAVVTAELMQTEWLPGEPEDPAAFPLRMTAPVVCSGSGTPFGAGMNPGTPPCGYTYIWQSLKERTDGLGRWVLQVTSHYQVTFDVTDTETGEVIRSGSDAVDTSSRVLMPIREWHGILGDPSLPAPDDQPVYPEILPPSSGTPG